MKNTKTKTKKANEEGQFYALIDVKSTMLNAESKV